MGCGVWGMEGIQVGQLTSLAYNVLPHLLFPGLVLIMFSD